MEASMWRPSVRIRRFFDAVGPTQGILRALNACIALFFIRAVQDPRAPVHDPASGTTALARGVWTAASRAWRETLARRAVVSTGH